MTFKANKNGTWVGGDDQSQGTVVYGKSGDNWLYAKSVWANKDGSWVRSWTDCRRHDTGGRDWLPTTLSAVYSGSCGNRTYQIPTRYTKDGCPSYDVAGSTVSSPDCNSSCFDASTSTVYSGSCTSRTSTTRTTYTAKAGSGCTTYFVDGTYTADPTCEGACTTAKTGTFSQGGITYEYSGPAGYYYAFPNPNCSSGCDFSAAYYYVTTCGGTNYITLLSSEPCVTVFGDPC
jgi:hypothetical protein